MSNEISKLLNRKNVEIEVTKREIDEYYKKPRNTKSNYQNKTMPTKLSKTDIDKAIKERDMKELEFYRVLALEDGNAEGYAQLCDEMGITPENKEIYDIGKQISLDEESKLKGLERIASQSSQEDSQNFNKYGVPDKCPTDFSKAWNSAMKVPRSQRPYQNLVRNRGGGEYMAPAYIVPINIKGIKKLLINQFPNDKENIEKLNEKQLKLAYHSIHGVYG